MKMTKGRTKALEILNWFIKDYKSKGWDRESNIRLYGVGGIKEDVNGLQPEESFFMFTETGKVAESVTSRLRLVELLVAQKRLALNIAMWKEGIQDHLTYVSDFDDEPEVIKELVKSIL